MKSIRDPAAETWLAVLDGKLAGFAVIRLQGAFVGYIQSIVIAPERRGKGVGSELLAFVEQRIFAQHPNVFICCSSFNPRALTLYRRHGYEIIGELRNYIVSGHSEILLRKTIAPLTEF